MGTWWQNIEIFTKGKHEHTKTKFNFNFYRVNGWNEMTILVVYPKRRTYTKDKLWFFRFIQFIMLCVISHVASLSYFFMTCNIFFSLRFFFHFLSYAPSPTHFRVLSYCKVDRCLDITAGLWSFRLYQQKLLIIKLQFLHYTFTAPRKIFERSIQCLSFRLEITKVSPIINTQSTEFAMTTAYGCFGFIIKRTE